jgi:nascent polypeptide-associated complex subunit alpha
VINQPEVFKSPASETYIIFGEAKLEDTSATAYREVAEKFKSGGQVDQSVEADKQEQPPLLVGEPTRPNV